MFWPVVLSDLDTIISVRLVSLNSKSGRREFRVFSCKRKYKVIHFFHRSDNKTLIQNRHASEMFFFLCFYYPVSKSVKFNEMHNVYLKNYSDMKLGSNANYSVTKNKIKTRQYSRSELTYFFLPMRTEML